MIEKKKEKEKKKNTLPCNYLEQSVAGRCV